jgi:hypothetical protein
MEVAEVGTGPAEIDTSLVKRKARPSKVETSLVSKIRTGSNIIDTFLFYFILFYFFIFILFITGIYLKIVW